MPRTLKRIAALTSFVGVGLFEAEVVSGWIVDALLENKLTFAPGWEKAGLTAALWLAQLSLLRTRS